MYTRLQNGLIMLEAWHSLHLMPGGITACTPVSETGDLGSTPSLATNGLGICGFVPQTPNLQERVRLAQTVPFQ